MPVVRVGAYVYAPPAVGPREASARARRSAGAALAAVGAALPPGPPEVLRVVEEDALARIRTVRHCIWDVEVTEAQADALAGSLPVASTPTGMVG